MALAYSQFGLVSPVLYAAYLSTHFDGDCSDPVVAGEGVFGSTVGSSACESGGGDVRECVAVGDAEAVFAFRALCARGSGRTRGGSGRAEYSGVRLGQVAPALCCGSAGVGSGNGNVAGAVLSADTAARAVDAQFGGGGGEEGVVRGKWYKKNKARKQKVKLLRAGCVESKAELSSESKGASVRDSSELQASLEGKWRAENELRKFEAERRLRLLREQDESTLVRMQRAQVMRTTETCKVQTEKAFASLRKSGDVVGSVETVVSNPSLTEGSSARSSGDCISPDSSVSQQEIRRMHQEILEMQRALEKVKENDPKLHAFAVKMGGLKTAFTLDTNGDIPIDEEGEIGLDGKFHMTYPRANVTTIKQQDAMNREYNEYLNGFDY